MSKRMTTLKKAMVLLSLGGTTFAFLGFLGFGGGFPGCVRNDNLVNFYQGVGDASIDAFADSTDRAIARITGSDPDEPTDFATVVIQPTATFFTALWDNWVAQQFPLDVGPTANVLRQ